MSDATISTATIRPEEAEHFGALAEDWWNPAGSSALRHRVLDAVSEAGAGLPTPPRLTFDGAVDLIVPAEMIEDVVAVVRESVTNVVRHARATHTDVGIQVDEDHVTIRIDDDGIGYAPGERASGTAWCRCAWGKAAATSRTTRSVIALTFS